MIGKSKFVRWTVVLTMCAGILTSLPISALAEADWTGREWNAASKEEMRLKQSFQIGREDAHSPFYPFARAEDALRSQRVGAPRDLTGAYVQSLDTAAGQRWKFYYVPTPSLRDSRPDNAHITEPDYDDSGWDEITVPQSWEASYNDDGTFKYNPPSYTNVDYVWSRQTPNPQPPSAPTQYNPVGFYRTRLQVDEAHRGRNIFLQFEGVESAFYVWINGKKVGYSTDSFTTKEFKIDEYLRFDGTDTLAVEVFKWSTGSWFEDQDMISLSGIFRSVRLVSKADVELRDFTILPKKCGAGNDPETDYRDFDLEVYVNLRKLGDRLSVDGMGLSAALYDADANPLPAEMLENAALQKTLAAGDLGATDSFGRPSGTVKLSVRVKQPRIWSAETPNLYKLLLTLTDAGGNPVETTAYRFGFRVIEIQNAGTPNAQVTLNGKKLLFKGVNTQECSATGRALSTEFIRRDLTMMKQNNFNAVRMSHYPHDYRYYDLADELGLYIMDEANLETHGARDKFENDPAYTGVMIDRLASAFYRSKNAPSVVFYSLGNEAGAGDNFGEMVRWLKGTYTGTPSLYADETLKGDLQRRPVHYEGDNDKADIKANMYTRIEDIPREANVNKPYIQMEFSHSMGNSNGYFKEYWEQFESRENIQGGFIWDWADQGILTYQTPESFPSQNTLGDRYGKEDTQYTAASQDALHTRTTLSGGAQALSAAGASGAADDHALTGRAVANPTPDALDVNRDITLEADVYPSRFDDGIHAVIAKGDGQYQIKVARSVFQFNLLGGTGWNTLETAIDPESWGGRWHHVAATYDAQTHAAALYLDDMQKPAATAVFTNVDADGAYNRNRQLFSVGCDVEHADRDWDGAIDNVRVYARALTAEVLSDTNRTASDAGVVYWQDFNGAPERATAAVVEGGYYGFGGDWGDTPNDNNFCANGIVGVDRTPHGSMLEIKRTQQDYVLSLAGFDTTRATLNIRSRARFTDASAYAFVWTLKENGKTIRSGTQTVSLAPQASTEVTLSFDAVTPVDDAEYFLTAKFLLKADTAWGKQGDEVSAAQMALFDPSGKSADKSPDDLPELTYTESETAYRVQGKDFTLAFDRTAGTIRSFVYKGVELFAQDGVHGPTPNFWRAPTDNDRGSFDSSSFYRDSVTAWRYAGANRTDCTTELIRLSGQAVKISVTGKLAPAQHSARYRMIFLLYADGRVEVENHVEPSGFTAQQILPAVGNLLQMPGSFSTLYWYGRGSDTEGLLSESYTDRKSGQFVDVYTGKVEDQYTAYSKVQTSGNKADVRWVALTNDDGVGLIATSDDDLFQVNAQSYTPEELTTLTTKHPYEAKRSDNVVLTLDHRQMGVGYDPGWLPKGWWNRDDLIYANKNYVYSYTLAPVDGFTADKAFALRAQSYAMDEPLLQAAKASVGDSIELPYRTYLDAADCAAAASKQLNAMLDSGVTAQVSYADGRYRLTLTRGDRTLTVDPFSVTVAPKPNLSADATLKAIIVNGYALPDVRGDVYTYSYTLSAGESLTDRSVQAIANDRFATVKSTVETDRILITVTAEDGRTVNRYTVTLRRPPALSGNAEIRTLRVKGKTLTAERVGGTVTYLYTLKSKEKVKSADLSITLQSDRAVKTIRRVISGTAQSYRIQVTAENGAVKTAILKLVPPKKGWLYTGNGKRYYLQKRKAVKGFKTIGGKRYYFGKKGVQKTGTKRFTVGGKTYMLKKGVVVCNKWIRAKKGRWYYAGKTGVFYKNGKKKINGKIYRFTKTGTTKR